jgi:hypothetical protein
LHHRVPGKTTVAPLWLVEQAWLRGRIVMLEPRRLATRAAARRMATLLGTEVGGVVGFQTRDERRIGRDTRIEVVTEGVLTRRLQHDPELPGVDLVIFDEIHERNVPTDLGLALTLDARENVRPDLRVLAMSATPDMAKVSAILGDAPTIESVGRTFDVDVRWLPMMKGVRLEQATGEAVAPGARRRARRRARVPSGHRRDPPRRAVPGRPRRSVGRRADARRRALDRGAGPRAVAVAERATSGGAEHRHRRVVADGQRSTDRRRRRSRSGAETRSG